LQPLPCRKENKQALQTVYVMAANGSKHHIQSWCMLMGVNGSNHYNSEC
jgi:hypothetical protein